jgi:gluconate 5-dehydrogenase
LGKRLKLFDLTGRIALVTGSSKGIGFAIARALASAGASIVLNGRDAAGLGRAQKALADEHGVMASVAVFDVTDPEAVTQGVAGVERDIGPIEILFNNAGMQHRTPLQDFPLDAWQRITAVNLDSVFFVGQSVARHMIPRGHGKIINICSVQSELGRPGIAPYSATKGAVKMLTKGMAIDWGKHGLQVNGLGPGSGSRRRSRFLWLARHSHADRPLGRGRGTRRCGHLSRLRRVELHQRPYPLCRWRNHLQPLSAHE